MKTTVLSLMALATAASAQTSSACAANYIVETCMGTEQAKIDSCSSQDYSCLCAAYQDLVTCFNNCPNDSRVFSYQGTQQIYCSYVSQFSSATKAAVATDSTTATTVATVSASTTRSTSTAATATTGTGTSSSGTTSASGSAITTANSAADLTANAAGVLAVLAGAVAALF